MRSVQPAVGFTSAPSAAMPSPLHRGVSTFWSDFLTDRKCAPLVSQFFQCGFCSWSNKTVCPRSGMLLAQYRSVISPCPGRVPITPFPGTAHTCCLCGWSLSASIHCCKSPVHMESNVPPFCMGGLGSEPDLCARLFARVWRKKENSTG